MYDFPTVPSRFSQMILKQLRDALPHEPTPEAREARELIAIAAVAALQPVDVAEMLLAVQVVAIEAHARECLRHANASRSDIKETMRWRSQSASLMRQSQATLRELLRYQAERPATRTRPSPPPPPQSAAKQPPSTHPAANQPSPPKKPTAPPSPPANRARPPSHAEDPPADQPARDWWREFPDDRRFTSLYDEKGQKKIH